MSVADLLLPLGHQSGDFFVPPKLSRYFCETLSFDSLDLYIPSLKALSVTVLEPLRLERDPVLRTLSVQFQAVSAVVKKQRPHAQEAYSKMED